MRTIGKENIKKVIRLTKRAVLDNYVGSDVSDEVHSHIPEDVYDIWEGAYDEIERIINDNMGVTE